jgi:DnaK suppressor protein
MTSQQREVLKARLEKLREQLNESGPARVEPTRKDASDVGVPDEDAQALTEMLQILASQQNKKQAEMLARINKALRTIAETPGDYGLCEECDEELPFKRLELMPYATLCTECQAARDPRRGTSRKSLTDFKE